MSDATLRADVPRGAYPERPEPGNKWLDRLWGRLSRWSFRSTRARKPRLDEFVKMVNAAGDSLDRLTESALEVEIREIRIALKSTHLADEAVARSFALVRHLAQETLEQRHYDVQLIGGWALLRGMVAEMDTGEGKTLTATLAASTAALAGTPVHVITVNDYLARRDAEWMGPLYEALGLSVGVIVHGMELDEKQEAYSKDIVYCTNKEIAFDYLRDRILLKSNPSALHLKLEGLAASNGNATRESRLLLRGLHFAIVDEADSVLIDEARTPLIISRQSNTEQERRAYETAFSLVDKLQSGKHYTLDRQERRVELTGAGRGKLEELGRSLGNVWARRKHREEMVQQALAARLLFVRDQHYLVKDEKVQIIDEYTGRAMPDRSWEHGLHQAIEVKEGCQLTARNEPIARISYQRFFRRYLLLAGMTGTAREVAGELGTVYGMSMLRVPTNRPLRRVELEDRVFVTSDERWKAVVERIREINAQRRPMLVGTRSVEASEKLSFFLMEAGLEHQVLNARQDEEEAEIIAGAGEVGRITVATNMAGRGTDIRLADGVGELGGLHVIATERHDAGRIDRQLFGRCGRQGDQGSFETFGSFEDDLVAHNAGKIDRWLLGAKESARLVATDDSPDLPEVQDSEAGPESEPAEEYEEKLDLPPAPDAVPEAMSVTLVPTKMPSPTIARWIVRRAQKTAEKQHRRARDDLLRMEEQLEKTLAFSGSPE